MAQSHALYTGHSPPLGPPPPPPPIPHTDQTRVYAKDQPPKLREAFTEFYPNGLPNVYKMLQTPGAGGVPQTYVEDYLPAGFYTNVRPGARAIFSTENGVRKFRHMNHLLPQRRIHLWSKDEIQSVCNSLRKLYWEHMKGMQKPYCWESLYTYFDGCDIYNYGALNLWNVTNQLFDENKLIYMDLAKELAVEIGHWADGWLANENNCNKLLHWDELQGPLLPLLTEEDWREIGNIQDDVVPLIASALKHRRSLLLSPEESKPGVKPNHLMNSCANDSLENWLAGQRIFTPSGLPSPPEAKSHQCSPASRNAPAPAIVHHNNHYYALPDGKRRSSAVEALHQSAAAAGPVVAHGSSQITRSEQPETDTLMRWDPIQASSTARSKSTEPVPSYSLDISHEATAPSDAQANSAPMEGHDDDECEQSDPFTPTKAPLKGRDNPRVTRGAPKSTVTASLPASAVLGFSDLATSPERSGNASQQPTQATSSPSKEDGADREGKNKGTKPRTSPNKDFKKGQRPNRSFARAGTHDPKSAQFLSKAHNLAHPQRPDLGFYPNVGSAGMPKEIIVPQVQPPLGITFHPAAGFSHATPGGYSHPQQNYAMPTGLGYRHPNVQQPPPPQDGLAQNRGRNASTSSRLDRFEPSERWPHQHLHDNFNDPTSAPNRGGYHRGGLRRGTNRRGSHNQRNATTPMVQQPNPDFVNKRRDGAPWKDQQWRRSGSDFIQVTCQNVQNGLTINDYVPCSCQMCDARNRSVHVAAKCSENTTTVDIQTRIKHGLAERYGHVEDVYPLQSKEPGRFLARFSDTSSVGKALAMGSGSMPEQGISVAFSPAMRSKWTVPTPTYIRETPSQGIGQPSFSPYPFGPSISINTQSTGPAAHTMPGLIHPAAVNLPHEYSGQGWPIDGAQRATSGFMRHRFSHQSSAITAPTGPQQNMHEAPRHNFTESKLPAPATADVERGEELSDELLQTKPPAEEALNEMQDAEKDGSIGPRSYGNKILGARARVSLPNSPAKATHSPEASSSAQTACRSPGDDVTVDTESTMKLDRSSGAKLETSTRIEVGTHPQVTAASASIGDTTSHHRVPSIFTENEIKGRREAWAKISMPLNPNKPKPSTPTKPHSDDGKDEATLRVPKGDRREAGNATGSEMSTPTQAVTFTPETGSVYEPSEKPEDEFGSQHEQEDASASASASHSARVVEEDAMTSGKVGKDEVQQFQATTGPDVAAALTAEPVQKNEKPTQSFHDLSLTNMAELNAPQRLGGSSHPNHHQEITSDSQSKDKTRKWKSKTKKKKGKQSAGPQGNVAYSPINVQDQMPSAPQRPDTRVMNTEPEIASHFESQGSSSSSPAKRHHEGLEQRSASGGCKRSKKHEHDQELPQVEPKSQQPSFDESDSPEEDTRGRRGYRMGRGGSLRMGKQRRPRPLMTSPALAEQHSDTQVPPPSSDFAFECSGVPASGGSQSLRGLGNSAKSRLNPAAQEFVSPSRLAHPDGQPAVVSSGIEKRGNTMVDDSAVPCSRRHESIREHLKTEVDKIETPTGNDSIPSATANTTPKHRRALSEVVPKHTTRKEVMSQGESKKTPSKNHKRGKGRDTALASSTKLDKVAGKQEKVQDTPHTPERRTAKMKKPGLINDDWPSLPVPRDRAPSKPQTPSIWGSRTKMVGDERDPEESPVTKG
ncbi:hypothetical protein F66182_2984 [Fusarium sp. NRRL 66182]|nr:hypothetical protein F66182_2984 [Fusarium sp. NRRL 66182]